MGRNLGWPFWSKVLCAGVTLVALWAVFHRIHTDTLIGIFKNLHWGWFAGAVLVYGALFIPAAARWHIVLRLSKLAVSASATMRLTLIGHFFYTVFFGSVGGDSAKAILYSRRYRFPITNVIATAPVDRLLGSVGMLIFSGVSLFLAYESGGLGRLGRFSVSRSAFGWGVAIFAVVVLIWLVRGTRPGSAWGKFVQSLRANIHSVARSPKSLVTGVFYGFLVQAALCAVVGLNLRAVAHESLPWTKLLWTFPVVVGISALPISIGGLGTREGAAIALFGLYGINETTAVATSLLTMAAILVWAIVGAGLFLVDFGARTTLSDALDPDAPFGLNKPLQPHSPRSVQLNS